MRTPRYLPGVRNGVVAKRQSRAKNPSTSKTLSVSASRRRRSSPRLSIGVRHRRHVGGEDRGSRVMWLMILVGVALAAGFVFALRSQINAYKIAQAEEQLKMQLDEYARQQKFLTVDQRRAMSISDGHSATRYGLDHLKLDRESDRREASARKFIPASPVRAAQDGDQNGRPAAGGRNGSRPEKRSPRIASPAKTAKPGPAVKTGKPAKIVNVVKLKAKNNRNKKRQ